MNFATKKLGLAEKIEILQKSDIEDLNLFSDLVFYIHEEDIFQEASQLINLLGGTITEQYLPNFTTHVIAHKINSHLRILLNSNKKQTHKHEGKLVGAVSFTTKVQVVTINWLRDTFLEERVMPIIQKYQPT